MPAAPGEQLLSTLFADVHYYFSDPARRPQHHRFDRASYVYIYHEPAQRQAKLEIANHAGTPDQDAFSGMLNTAHVTYSYKQPTLCTLLVDDAGIDQAAWRLPAYDEGNEAKYLYRIHSLDIYLWTERDAGIFLGHLKAVMPSDGLNLRDAPSTQSPVQAPAEHSDSMSPVVQQLEHTAIGAQFPPREGSTHSTYSLLGAPTPVTTSSVASPAPPAAYNPAAPAAPEPIAYREKTPPPPDAGSGTGLVQNSNQPTPQQAYFPAAVHQTQPSPFHSGPSFSGPAQLAATPGGFGHGAYGPGVPPPPPGAPPVQQTAAAPSSYGGTLPNQPPTSPPAHQQHFARQPSFGPNAAPSMSPFATASPPPQLQYANQPQSPDFGGYGHQQQPSTPSAPPAYAGHTPFASPGLPPQPPGNPGLSGGPNQTQHGLYMAGFSNYTYTSGPMTQQVQGQLNQYGAYTGDVHHQLYRPTEDEAAHGHAHPKPQVVRQGSAGAAMTRVEERVSNTEKKVAGFLKRLDKLI